MAEKASGRSVKLFLADGTAHGIIIAEIGNWTGKVLAGPRGRLGDLLKRPEAGRTGVYFLLGPDPERAGGLLAYIGEADDIAARMRNHLRAEAKDFADRFAFVVSSDEALTKAHARYLEAQLIRRAADAGAVTLTNDTAPDFQRLPESDKADMAYFQEQVQLVLPLMGFDLFRASYGQGKTATPDGGGTIFTFTTRGAAARGQETEDGFVILAGSTARVAPSGTFPGGYRALREQLLAARQLVVETPEFYRFAADVTFSSPSAAASIVAARSASGPLEWKLERGGQTYRDWHAARLDQPS